MNIIDAIKSGKRFRRKGWDDYLTVDENFFLNEPSSIKKELMLADDWEVESQTVTINREQFNKAWHENVPASEPYSLLVRDSIAKELGL